MLVSLELPVEFSVELTDATLVNVPFVLTLTTTQTTQEELLFKSPTFQNTP